MKNMQPHILVVEDSTIASRMTSFILKELDCLVDVAETGEEALDMVKQKKYDLIFMDLGLPDTTGIAVTKKIKQMQDRCEIPVIVLTAHINNEKKKACLEVGVIEIIVKPLEKEKARDILKKMFNKTVWGLAENSFIKK